MTQTTDNTFIEEREENLLDAAEALVEAWPTLSKEDLEMYLLDLQDAILDYPVDPEELNIYGQPVR